LLSPLTVSLPCLRLRPGRSVITKPTQITVQPAADLHLSAEPRPQPCMPTHRAAVASGTALTVGSGTPVASSQAAIGATLASVAASTAVLYAGAAPATVQPPFTRCVTRIHRGVSHLLLLSSVLLSERTTRTTHLTGSLAPRADARLALTVPVVDALQAVSVASELRFDPPPSTWLDP